MSLLLQTKSGLKSTCARNWSLPLLISFLLVAFIPITILVIISYNIIIKCLIVNYNFMNSMLENQALDRTNKHVQLFYY
ncbi:hypothetical protein HanRHA438_Chr06g0280761 [Helianthus annuus]|nr:hypothetical protein HanRHA438_Chr06g0280761 [Helianthus annuus]